MPARNAARSALLSELRVLEAYVQQQADADPDNAAKAAGRRAAYDWEWSADGGKTWTQAPSTLQAKTTIVGLPVGATVLFRFRAVVKTGEGDWSQPMALLVK